MGRRPDDRKHRLLKEFNATIVDCKGVSHTGEWTTSELQQMHDNVSFYLGKHNLPLKQLLQGVGGKQGKQKWLDLSYKIYRPITEVRTKVNYYYNYWLSLRPDACSKPLTRRSRYSEEEDKRLLDALNRMHTDVESGLFDEERINWHTVALFVKTRSAFSCMQHWEFYLSEQEENAHLREPWRHKDVYRMCRVICDYVERHNIESFRDIPWQTIKDSEDVRQPVKRMRKKFRNFLNARNLSSSKRAPLLEIVRQVKNESRISAITTAGC